MGDKKLRIADLKKASEDGKHVDISPNGDVTISDKKPRPTIKELLAELELKESNEKQREAFELWAKTHFSGNHWSLDRCHKEDSAIYGKYLWVHIEEAWITWQATIADMLPVLREVEGALANCRIAMLTCAAGSRSIVHAENEAAEKALAKLRGMMGDNNGQGVG